MKLNLFRKDTLLTFFMIFISIFLLISCTKPFKVYVSEKDDIVVFGDGFSSGLGLLEPSNQTYSYYLSKRLNRSIKNISKDYLSTSDFLNDIKKYVKNNPQTKVVISSLGRDDLKQKIDKETIKKNIDDAINFFEESGIFFILLAEPIPSLSDKQTWEHIESDIYESFKKSSNVHIIGNQLTDFLNNTDSVNKNSKQYLNERAYYTVGTQLANYMNDNGFFVQY